MIHPVEKEYQPVSHKWLKKDFRKFVFSALPVSPDDTESALPKLAMSNERRTLQDSYVPASLVLLVDAPVLVLLMFLVFLLAKCYSSSATASTLCLSRLKLWTNGSSAQWFKQRNLCCPKKGNNLEGVQTVVKSCAYLHIII